MTKETAYGLYGGSNEGVEIRLTSDLVFKAVFGRELAACKKALSGLLNAILADENDPVIDIRYLNPFHTQEYDSGKTCCMDIEVEIQSGFFTALGSFHSMCGRPAV